MKKINRKIPGEIPPSPKKEIDGKITDLSSKTIQELFELRDRQLKLINNKYFISKLSDKGAKIQIFYNKIVSEIRAKQNEEETCKMFENLKLNGVDRNSVQLVEWTGTIKKTREVFLDSDDDSEPEDVLHILSHTTQEKALKVLQPEKPLITPDDLLEIGEIPHVRYIVEKTEIKPKPKLLGQYKPYKTTKSDVHNPEKEILSKKHKNWEITAATPPPIIHGPTKILSIEESLKLQRDYNAHLREIEVKHAAEKLLARTGIKMAELPAVKTNFNKYRDLDSDDDDSNQEGSDVEVHDDEPERGGVVFTVMT